MILGAAAGLGCGLRSLQCWTPTRLTMALLLLGGLPGVPNSSHPKGSMRVTLCESERVSTGPPALS